MTLTELKIDLASLNSADKAAAIEILLQTLSTGAIGIKKTPSVCGGDACVGNTRIPVWSLVCDRHLGASDGIILESFPDLTAADLVNAWAYADAYPEEIEQAIKENDEVMEESEVY
jgi:uncharacterized protein (DUF433 family)